MESNVPTAVRRVNFPHRTERASGTLSTIMASLSCH
jgi:hypothetical protein